MKRTLPLLLLLSTLPLGSLRGQEIVTVPVLTDLRVESPTYQGVGSAADATPSALTLFLPEQRDPVTIPFATIERLEVERRNSWRSGAFRGAKWGALAGAAALVVYYGLAEVAFPDQEAFQDINWAATGTLFVVGGGAAGAAYGAYRPGERWEPVPEPIRLRVVR